MGLGAGVICPNPGRHPCQCNWHGTVEDSARLCSRLECQTRHRRPDRDRPGEEILSPKYGAAVGLNHSAARDECDHAGLQAAELARLLAWERGQ